MRTFTRGRPVGALACAGACVVMAGGCLTKKPPEQHFFDQHIQPVLNSFCVGNTSPCHKVDPATGTALGNLDLTSFDNIQKRRDVLRTYGSYPHPLLLLKALPEASVSIPYQGTLYPSEIRHAGGKPIDPGSDAFYELKRWLDNGANRDGIEPAESGKHGDGSCNTGLPPASSRAAVDTTKPSYQTFVDTIQPFLLETCAYGTCHSSPQADFYITCGTDDEQRSFNYAQVAGFVAPTGTAIEQSEILLRPLSPQAGGVSHTGGVFFKARDDNNKSWYDLKSWALQAQSDQPLALETKSTGRMFFEANVMPRLLQRGCALEGCHSPDGFNDFRIRSGSNGAFSPQALRRNYQALADEFMAFDSVDVKQSRAVKKNITPEVGGITHRAGPILEDSVAIDTPCPQSFDATTNTRAFCVFKEWHRLERMDRAADVSAMAASSTLPLAFVSRPPNGDKLIEFDTFEGGADLKLADATIDANGGITGVGNIRSALGGCAGLAAGTSDVRGPEWSYDGTKVIFAGRPSMGGGLDLYAVDVPGLTCTRLTSDGGTQVGGVPVHNFDPVFAPDGSVVFASTRAGTWTLYNYLPNSNLYRVKPTPSLDFNNVEQMTFLLNAEMSPAFMQDGRVSMTTEKVAPDVNQPNGVFYQLAGRRINWDLSDYHPLLAQRSQSTDTFTPDLQPSVDYQQATEIREGLDRNFLIILSDADAKGAGGALATFNRSIGPFQANRDEVTFVRSLKIIDPAATGKAGTSGVYRSPFSLPNGEIMASYDGAVTDPASASPHYALVAVNEQTGARRMLAGDGTLSYVEATLGYKRGERLLFSNLPQLVFGGHEDASAGSGAIMHFPDGPLLATLLGANLRRGRDVKAMDKAVALKVYEETPPPARMTPGTLYTSRNVLGQASFESDKSLKVLIPAGRPLILEFIDGGGKPVLTMTEEHQVTPGEYITPGPPRALFNNICGGCHGSISGSELDIAVSADALTGASVSLSRGANPKSLQ